MLSYKICNACRLSYWPDTSVLQNPRDWWPCPIDMVHRSLESEIPDICVRKFEQAVFEAMGGEEDESYSGA